MSSLALALLVALAAGAEQEPSSPEVSQEESLAPEGEPAAEPETSQAPADSYSSPYSSGRAPLLHGKLALSLGDALKMSLENNLDVQVERYGPIIAESDETIAWGVYDPNLFAEFGYTDAKTPSANTLSGTTQVIDRDGSGFGGIRGVLPLSSTEYEARFEGGRETINVPFRALSPEYTSGWSVSLTQPVLRDLIWNEPWTQVRTTRLLLQASHEDFRRAVMDTVSDTEDAYWALIAEDESRRVAEKSLETAKALLDQTQTQYDVGVVSKVEVVEAEAGLSQREVNLIRAENAYLNQQDVLIDLVLGPGLRSNSTLEIDPTDAPQDYVPYTIDVPTAVQRAFEHRPELAAADKEIEREEVDLKFAQSQRLPELDGIFSFGQNGLSGRVNPDFSSPLGGLAPESQGNFGKAQNDYHDNPTFTARARFGIAFPNTSARETVSKTQMELARAVTQKRRLEQSIIVEVRRSARNLEASQEAIDAARDAERAAQEQLRAERIRLEYGESTPFDVLQREEDLVDRENELIGAFQAYRTSVTALDRAQGTILRNRNIKIAEVEALR
jgi:outer membrane protein TolC